MEKCACVRSDKNESCILAHLHVHTHNELHQTPMPLTAPLCFHGKIVACDIFSACQQISNAHLASKWISKIVQCWKLPKLTFTNGCWHNISHTCQLTQLCIAKTLEKGCFHESSAKRWHDMAVVLCPVTQRMEALETMKCHDKPKMKMPHSHMWMMHQVSQRQQQTHCSNTTKWNVGTVRNDEQNTGFWIDWALHCKDNGNNWRSMRLQIPQKCERSNSIFQ